MLWRTSRNGAVRRGLSPGATALFACAGYYLTSYIGLGLRVDGSTTSVLWPPNAVLTSALILTAPRSWWMVLLAVLPVHVVMQVPTGWPPALIGSLFLTNSSEAIIAAGGLWLLSDDPPRFDTLRRIAVFLAIGVVAAPALSSFGDAAVVSTFQGEPYWQVWRVRTLSNMLAELTVVPGLVGAVITATHLWRERERAPWGEAAVLAGSLLTTAWFQAAPVNVLIGAISSSTPLALQLPLILWAAVRFGSAGAGLALLTTNLATIWSAVHGVGPFASIAASSVVLPLTVSLLMVSATLMCLATLIEERRNTQQALSRRLEFEALLSRLSADLVRAGSHQQHDAFDEWLGRICGVLNLDALAIYVVAPDTPRMRRDYGWTAPHTHLSADHAAAALAEWAVDASTLRRRVDAPAGQVAGGLRRGGALPLEIEQRIVGVLAFGLLDDRPRPRLPDHLRLIAELLANAIGRRLSDEGLRASEETKSAILTSLTAGVAVLDARGVLLQTNEQWHRSVKDSPWLDGEPGTNLLTNCSEAAESIRFARLVHTAIHSVLSGGREQVDVEHAIDSGSQASWWSLTVAPLRRPQGGVVLLHSNLTDLRRAEIELQNSRQQLAHVGRVSTVGEMTAALAHQLNQPLTAVLANVQAARRLMMAATPDLDSVRAILADILSDNRRATDVVQNLRDFLRNTRPRLLRLHVPALLHDVYRLMNSEAIFRNVELTVNAEGPMFVRADRVQLQQVILNLVHNAMDAVAAAGHRGNVALACYPDAEGIIVLTVTDTGPGLTPGTEETIFDAFYTTKRQGMGMGLAIVRTIVTAHRGTVRAYTNPEGGATFEVRLPSAEMRVAANEVLSA